MTTWLTQITPDPRSRHARRDLGNAVRMHQRVLQLVPDGLGHQARLKAGMLHRVDNTPHGTRILVQTQIQPDPGRLPPGYGTVQVKELDPLLHWLRPGALVRYRIAASTCLRKSHPDKDSGEKTVIPLRGADADKWWIDRAPAAGLDLQSLISKAPGDLAGTTTAGGPGRVRHTLTQFDGIAAVTDPDTLAAAITTGLGRGKAHGCGLLSIAPVNSTV